MPEKAPAGGIVLDTHVWLWVVEGETYRLAAEAVREIGEASRTGGILVSAISVWEVAMLEQRGRIALARPLADWIRAALRAPGVSFLGLTPEIAIGSTRLPGPPHADPADRILIASARAVGGRLATCDGRIIDYAKAGHVGVLDARR